MNLPETAGALLETLREGEKTAVHCIVGGVAEAFTAETLQSIGVAASMTHDPREVKEFVEGAGALLVQLGTLSELKAAGMLTAVDTARRNGKPWVFDPRSANRSIYRGELARNLAENRPRVICGKAEEITAITRTPRGANLKSIAHQYRTTIVQCGVRDAVVDPLGSSRVLNHSRFMDNINSMSCALAAMCAAFAAVETDGYTAACAAILVARVAGERAGAKARGTGSFTVRFLDEISTLTKDDILAGGRFETIAATPDNRKTA